MLMDEDIVHHASKYYDPVLVYYLTPEVIVHKDPEINSYLPYMAQNGKLVAAITGREYATILRLRYDRNIVAICEIDDIVYCLGLTELATEMTMLRRAVYMTLIGSADFVEGAN